MAFRPKTVFETIMYEYAKLIADRAVDERDSSAPAARSGSAYWSFVAHTFRRLNAGRIAPSAVLRENKLLMRTGAVCAYCDAAEQLQWEHIIPISRGGPDTIDNMVLACAVCNRSKAARNPLEWYSARGLGRRDVPRLVMGKLLKVVLEEHRLRGTDQAAEFPEGQELHLTGVCLVFEQPAAMPKDHVI